MDEILKGVFRVGVIYLYESSALAWKRITYAFKCIR